MLIDRLNNILVSLGDKIDELSSLIIDEPESMAQDIIYEELVYYLSNLKVQIEVLVEIILSNER